MSTPPTAAYVAVGANLGDRAATIDRAIRMLAATPGIRVLATSPLLENPSVGGPADAPAYLNGVTSIETTLEPHVLLDRLLEIERELGRVRRERWEPRSIDLDLILYGDAVLHTDRLTLPHPRMHERRFVLEPLAAVAPSARHPTSGKTAAQLLAELGS